MKEASFKLLRELDVDNNGKIDIIFEDNSLEISSVVITGIPYDWQTEVQVRVWK
jgi:hypothetical protein